MTKVTTAISILVFGSMSHSALAMPINDISLIEVRQFENRTTPSENTLIKFTTTNNSVSNALPSNVGSDIRVRGDLSTGQTGSVATSTSAETNNIASRIQMFDTLNFSTSGGLPTNITFGLNFDGSLTNDGTGISGGASTAQAKVSIFDITGLNTWLVSGGTITYANPLALLVADLRIEFAVGSQDFIDIFSPSGFFDELIVNTSGQTFDFDLSKQTSFLADPSKTYGIQLSTRTGTIGGGSSNFLNTSAFQFTNLNGASFTSGSGAFLSNSQVNFVPEPSSVLLVSTAFLLLIGFRRKRGQPS
ncbi:PEP-CTERM sorting domain-containing protein [Neptunomonas japonica]|uniref:PEP-CTERM sorting domain-containing protein n=1 Tax=Neptunomonas japonica TaxID=417574 RepID=UPI0003FEA30A|nr:PEP-CTERM sorting domain-containing protein [Neptunomonas japonica]